MGAQGPQAVAICVLLYMTCLGGATAAPAGADPSFSPAEQQFLADLYQYVHPSVTPARLIELGNLACTVRRNGSSTDDATTAVWHSLDRQGVVSSKAEVGTLVHVAVDRLCPEVGYP